jgi:cell division protein FtsZ
MAPGINRHAVVLIEVEKQHMNEMSGRSASAVGSRPLVIGLGQVGINILDQVQMYGQEVIDALAIDTDQLTIEASVVTEKLLLGARNLRGLGTMGDAMRARQLWKEEAPSVVGFLEKRTELIVITGLGGGTGSGFALELVKLAKTRGLRTLVLCTMPFSFESVMRVETAKRVLAELKQGAEAVLVMDNERMLRWADAKDNLRRCYHRMNCLMAHAVEAIARTLAAEGMTPLSFSDLTRLFGARPKEALEENCWLGYALAATPWEPEAMVEELLQSDLLQDRTIWDRAQSCLVCLVGGRDLALADLQALTQALEKKLPAHVQVRLGARLTNQVDGKIEVTLLVSGGATAAGPSLSSTDFFMPDMPRKVSSAEPVSTAMAVEETPLVEAPSVPIASAVRTKKTTPIPILSVVSPAISKKGSRQEELPFDVHRGRFDKSCETIYRGENLDQPTFRRRKLEIKL